MRDFKVRNNKKVKEHETGRICSDPKCKGELQDSIINFGENLPEWEITEGFKQSKKADLCLALGSSLLVAPAANMPKEVAEHYGDLVIVNLQKTPLDDICCLKINAFIDTVLEKVMAKLNLEIPEFTVPRRMIIDK